VVTKLTQKIDRMRSPQGIPTAQRWLFLGDPGIGKTEAALALARRLTSHPSCIEQVNGQSCSVELVRNWRDSLPYRPMFGDGVKLIDELDLASLPAQNELLTVLEKLPPWQHVIATTNKTLNALAPRLQTRFQQYPFGPVPTGELATLLTRFGVAASVAASIAASVAGNVRAGLLDAQSNLDMA
jgi:DNA polymerase III delta prime subunit